MKVTVKQKNFKRALGMVERVVSKNPSLPILSNILIKTESGLLKLAATNLEIGVNCVAGAKIDEVGEIAVPAKVLYDFINGVSDETITLQAKNNILNINSEKYKTQILGFDVKDFPIIPRIKPKESVMVPARILRNLLSAVIDSVALSETRPELAGVYTEFGAKKLTLASTDSFRLTEVSYEIKSPVNQSVIVPRNTALELIRILGDVDSDVEIKIGDNQISFAGDDFELISRLIDGNYPDYKKVIPTQFISKVFVHREDLEKDARLAGLFSSSISDIKISCDKDAIFIKSKNSDRGEIETSVPATLKNDPFDIAVNYHYILDGLKIMNSDKVVIEFTGSGNPLVLRPEDGNRELTYLIMPLRG